MKNKYNIVSFDYINENNRTQPDVLFGVRMVGVIDSEKKKIENEKLPKDKKKD